MSLSLRSIRTNQPKKSLGQNFLVHQGWIQRIISIIDPKRDDHIVEIGPGRGALTLPISRYCGRLDLLELDAQLALALQQHPALANPATRLYACDAGTFDYGQLIQPGSPGMRIIGNLPYNASLFILRHLCGYVTAISDMHLMFQREVGERLQASPGSKAFGRISILIQAFFAVTCSAQLPPEAFYPVPQVHSQYLRFTPQVRIAQTEFPWLEKITLAAFQQRRKQIKNTLAPWFTVAELEALAIAPGARAEDLSVATFLSMTDYLSRRRRKPAV